MDDKIQFETIVLIRAYAEQILRLDVSDIRPSTAKIILRAVSHMHNLKDQLETRS